MRPPRRLSPDEAAMWRKVADTVVPLQRRRPDQNPQPVVANMPDIPAARTAKAAKVAAQAAVAPPPPPVPTVQERSSRNAGLDASWERRITRTGIDPDFSLDLHGATLDQAYMRLMHGLAQARAMGARVVLVVTGKPRPAEAADRGRARGAIRAKIIDWLGASEHAGAIAAIRSAHRRHGGAGALYVVLKRRR